MLPKKHRADKKTLETVFKEGKHLKSPNFLLRYLPARGFKISFVVPKTVAKSAVLRNRLRRRGYAALEKYSEKNVINLTGAFVFGKRSMELFSARKDSKHNPLDNMAKEIEFLLSRAK